MGLADWIVDFFFSFFFFLQDHVLYLIPSPPATSMSNFRTNLVLGMFGFLAISRHFCKPVFVHPALHHLSPLASHFMTS